MCVGVAEPQGGGVEMAGAGGEVGLAPRLQHLPTSHHH